MRLIDADAFDDVLIHGELKARKARKYVLESAINTIRGNLAKMPTIEERKAGRWIPVTERLPEKYGNYLITTGEEEIDLGSYDPDRPGSWSACDAKGFHWVVDVVAWMPLPEPYQAERREE